jgi:hypothetical protein
MRPLKTNLILAIIMSYLTFGSCEPGSDKEADKKCDENKLTTVFDRYIEVNYEFARGINLPAAGHDALDAVELTFTGSVRKMDCRDQESSFFKIDCSTYPSLLAKGKTSYKFPVLPAKPDQSFYFHFYNNLEYISVLYTMRVVFNDGTIYQSTETYSNTNRIKYWTSGDLATYTINMNGTVTWKGLKK